MRYYLVIATAMMLAAAANTSVAGPEKFQKKGFISNDAGEKCWYQQRVIEERKLLIEERLTRFAKSSVQLDNARVLA